MSEFSFIKLSGAGNDFVLFDRKINPELKINTGIIKKICNRKNGIGADGVLVISDVPELNFEMEYYNSDGSTGSLCGNGARCAIKYSDISGRISEKNAKFKCANIVYTGEVLSDENIRFDLKSPENYKDEIELNLTDHKITASYIDSGSPHVVIYADDVRISNNEMKRYSINELPVYQIGREIRYNKEHFPDGANVNFVESKAGINYIRTYERGVESETLACGTGTVAAAIVLNKQKMLRSPVRFVTKGGDNLSVEFNIKAGKYGDVSLTGPAKVIFEGNINL